MVWVLWDILIPLLASFALGTLLGWLLWSWRRQRHDSAELTVESAEVSSDATIAVTTGGESIADEPMKSVLPDTEAEVTHSKAINHSDDAEPGSSEESAATSETKSMEAANIVLINERDQANQALENLQCETDTMRERIAELEAATQHSSVIMPANSDTGNTEQTKDNEESDHLRTELQQLNNTLEKERKARRATELELLNIKNKHDKLAKKKLSTADAAELNDEAESSRATTVPEVSSADQSTTLTETGINSSGQNGLVESGASNVKNQAKHPAIANNGQDSKGWSIAQEKPPTQEKPPARKKTPAKKHDKLTDIRGVGPVLEKMLNENGIYYFDQVANLDESGMEELQLQIPQCAGRIKRDGWVKQAKKLQLKKYGEMA